MNKPRVVSQTLLRVGIKCALHEFDARTNTHFFLMREEELLGLTRDAHSSLLEFHGLTPHTITKTVADFFGLTMDEMMSNRRTERIVWPRQVAMTIIRRATEISLYDVGQFFGGKDHGTVLHAERRVAGREETEPAVKTLIVRLMDILGKRIATENNLSTTTEKLPLNADNMRTIKSNFSSALSLGI